MTWYSDDDRVDPALAPLIEAGQGESEGFELAEQQLIRNATDLDRGSTLEILRDADQREEEEQDAVYGEADEEVHADA